MYPKNICSAVDSLAYSCIRGLFDNADDEQEFAFRVAIDRINNDNGVLLRSRLLPHIERLDKDDSFRATKKGEPSIHDRIFSAPSVYAPISCPFPTEEPSDDVDILDGH
ncbi:hypothetical protein IscW_ISCW023272 [Ixodes scapularis]|uniref:Receptor ligand binding region domain-containing protein n=1 Tax=Ixodes scapularis TaxID=6945 RepID=B7QJW2_IXOSC|nr:hypothetical protein IscW_ISCW023272 [Ixodes scapularis]|eukprot:XP_002415469.1 hypothetical protein IscW_ISCW023272 [Ixodes scapularis]